MLRAEGVLVPLRGDRIDIGVVRCGLVSTADVAAASPVGYWSVWVKGHDAFAYDYAAVAYTANPGWVFNNRVDDLPRMFLGDFLIQTEYDWADAFSDYISWTNLIIAWDTGHSDGNKKFALYVNGILRNPTTITDGVAAFDVSWNDQWGFLGTTFHSPTNSGDFADMQLNTTVSIVENDNTITALNLAKIINGGKPVDPAIAAAAFGQQTVLFSGDATTFGTNRGTGGAFTLTGTLTDADTSPSD
jgi:hypothetical protein